MPSPTRSAPRHRASPRASCTPYDFRLLVLRRHRASSLASPIDARAASPPLPTRPTRYSSFYPSIAREERTACVQSRVAHRKVATRRLARRDEPPVRVHTTFLEITIFSDSRLVL